MLRSTVKLGRHPLHPILVLFPIGFWLSTLLTDIVYWLTRAPGWANAAMVLVAAGIIAALVAALAGLGDFLGDRAIRDIPDAWHHMIGNIFAVAVAGVSLMLRMAQGAEAAVLPWGLTLSIVVALTLLFTGWKGGELVFRHRVGVEPDYAEGGMRVGRHEDEDRPVLH